eukprot:UN24745
MKDNHVNVLNMFRNKLTPPFEITFVDDGTAENYEDKLHHTGVYAAKEYEKSETTDTPTEALLVNLIQQQPFGHVTASKLDEKYEKYLPGGKLKQRISWKNFSVLEISETDKITLARRGAKDCVRVQFHEAPLGFSLVDLKGGVSGYGARVLALQNRALIQHIHEQASVVVDIN